MDLGCYLLFILRGSKVGAARVDLLMVLVLHGSVVCCSWHLNRLGSMLIDGLANGWRAAGGWLLPSRCVLRGSKMRGQGRGVVADGGAAGANAGKQELLHGSEGT